MAQTPTPSQSRTKGRREATPAELDTFARFLQAAETEAAEMDPDEVSMDIIRRILAAETLDDILEPQTALHARDIIDKPFQLLDVRFNKSSLQNSGPQFYALLDIADQDGEKQAVTCGARNVIAQAWRMRDLELLPTSVVLRESKRETANGNRVMWLERDPSY